MSEIQKLLKELCKLANDQKAIPNTAETWSKIGTGQWAEAGFADENELKEWIESNPYVNL